MLKILRHLPKNFEGVCVIGRKKTAEAIYVKYCIDNEIGGILGQLQVLSLIDILESNDTLAS